MTVPKDKTYPVDLTDADWQKKKSFLDKTKSKTKTGLGEALKEAQKAWAAIPFKSLSRRSASMEHDDGWLAGAKAAQATAKKELDPGGHVPVAIAKLKAAKTKADAAVQTNQLSKTANAAAKSISAKLQTKITDLEAMNMSDMDKAVKEFEDEIPLKRHTYSGGYTTVVSKLAGLNLDLTKKGWDKAGMKGEVAEALTFCKQVAGIGVPEFRKARLVWESMSTLTEKADSAIKGKDAAADKKVISQYLTDIRVKIRTVPSQ